MGGMPDHIHILVEIPPILSLTETIRYVKVGATKWLHQNIQEAHQFEWQEGYGAFAVSASIKPKVIEYIQNQETHHKTRDFKEEFLQLLKLSGIEFDPQYLWR